MLLISYLNPAYFAYILHRSCLCAASLLPMSSDSLSLLLILPPVIADSNASLLLPPPVLDFICLVAASDQSDPKAVPSWPVTLPMAYSSAVLLPL